MKNVQDGSLVRVKLGANGIEYEIRRVIDKPDALYYAVFLSTDSGVPIISEAQDSRDDAARAGDKISEIIS